MYVASVIYVHQYILPNILRSIRTFQPVKAATQIAKKMNGDLHNIDVIRS